MSDSSRTQHFRVEYSIPAPGFHNRRAELTQTWFKLEGGLNGNEAYAITLESHKSPHQDHESLGFTKSSVQASTRGIYIFERLAPRSTRFTMLQQGDLGGHAPIWVKNLVASHFLSMVVELQKRFKRSGGDNSSEHRSIKEGRKEGMKEEMHVEGSDMYAELLFLRRSIEEERDRAAKAEEELSALQHVFSHRDPEKKKAEDCSSL